MAKQKKYYIVPAEVMESNFPDDLANGKVPESWGVIESNGRDAKSIEDYLERFDGWNVSSGN